MSEHSFISVTAEKIWADFEKDISRLESRRTSILLFMGGTFFGIIAFGMVGLLFSHPHSLAHYQLVTVIVAALPTLFMYRSLKRGFWLSCKPLSHNIVRKILGNAYRSHSVIETDTLMQHGIMMPHSRLYKEDGYAAGIHGYQVKFQEIDTVRSFGPASVREWREISISNGLYIHIRLKRDLHSHTILMPKNTLASIFLIFLRRHMNDYKPVGLVSPRFTNNFEVLTNDQVEARVAFHPAFMEKFMELAGTLRASSIEASFKEDQLLIFARYEHDLFQLGSLWRPLSIDDIQNLIHELTLYEDIIDTLKLNPYTAP